MIEQRTRTESCRACGQQVPQDFEFCGFCGARLAAGEPKDGDPLIGKVVDQKFRIESCIATGGMGSVYRAENVVLGKQVAIKFLRADLRDNVNLVHRLRREAQAVSRLTDVHTISVFDFGVWQGLAYLVMEYLHGEDLATLLNREKTLSVARAVRMAKQICSSLIESHSLGVVHRDLKPENIFLTRSASGEESLKVLDFGLAKILDPGEERSGRFQTQDGALLGTPYYMAPEQVEGAPVDPRTDLYALGALLYRMITGTLPFTGRTPMEVFAAQKKGDLTSFSEMLPTREIHTDLEALVRDLLSHDSTLRPESATLVSQRLERLLAQEQSADSTAAKMPSIRPAEARAGADVMDVPESASADRDMVDEMPSGSDWFETDHQSDSSGTWEMGPSYLRSSSVTSIGDEPAFTNTPISEEGDDDDKEPHSTEDLLYVKSLKRRRIFRQLLFIAFVGSLGLYYWSNQDKLSHAVSPFEVEPNDVASEANQLLINQEKFGFIGKRTARERSDQDVYLLKVPSPGGGVTIRVSGVPGLDLVLEVFTFQGELIEKKNGAAVGRAEEIHLEQLDPNTQLQIRVREYWVEGERPTENSTDKYVLLATLSES